MPKFGLEHITDQALSAQFSAERQHLQGSADHPDGSPRIGLAMSGGGTKAGMFSHGVLHGLQDQGILQKVDVISTSSGGGYAAYWYMSKLLEADRLKNTDQAFVIEDVFRDCFPAWINDASAVARYEARMTRGDPDSQDQNKLKSLKALAAITKRGEASALALNQEICQNEYNLSSDGKDSFRWQAHLMRWPDVMNDKITPIEGGSAQPKPTASLIPLGFYSLAELATGWLGPDDSAVSRGYQWGIERAWGLNPLPRYHARARASETGWSYTNAAGYNPRERQLHADPTTMQWADLQALYAKGKPRPPLWILNTNVGDKEKLPNLDHLYELTPFGRGTATLGYLRGAPPLDSIALGLRASAGFADSQGLASKSQREMMRGAARFLPSLQWGVPINHPTSSGIEKLRMSDGGGADNLALISVARRGLRDIIVVDTAADIDGSMGDLCWSREALAKEGLKLEFEKLDQLEKLCDGLFKRATNKNPTGEAYAYNVSAWLNPVLHGTISWGKTGRKTNIWLIKAAWDQQAARRVFNAALDNDGVKCGPALGQIDCTVMMFYGHDTSVRTDAGYMIFPQHSTAKMTLNASSKLMLAYRELGRMLAKNLRLDSKGQLEIATEQTCVQKLLPAREDMQPENQPGRNVDPRASANCEPTRSAALR